jgi:hypothetical protein
MPPVLLDLSCAKCGGEISVQMIDWPDQELHAPRHLRTQPASWACPYCAAAETATLPAPLAWVTKRVVERVV